MIQHNLEKNLIEEMERHLVVAAEPLLSHLISEADFREVYYYLLDTINIIKYRVYYIEIFFAGIF